MHTMKYIQCTLLSFFLTINAGAQLIWSIDSDSTGHWDIFAIDISPDGTQLASASRDGTIKVWNLENGKEILRLKGHSNGVSSITFSPDGTQLVSGSWDSTIRIWDLLTGEPLIGLPFIGHTSYINSVDFSSDGTQIVSGSPDETIRVWDAKTGRQLQSFMPAEPEIVTSVAFSPDDKLVASNQGVWDVVNGMQLHEFEASCTSVKFSPDGKLLACGGYQSVDLWDVDTFQKHKSLSIQGDHSINFSHDGTQLVVQAYCEFNLFNVSTGEPLGEIIEDIGTCDDRGLTVVFSRSGKQLIYTDGDHRISIRDIASKKEVKRLHQEQHMLTS